MSPHLDQLSRSARSAATRRDWQQVFSCAGQILALDSESAEGYFLMGLAEQAARHGSETLHCFSRSLSLDAKRYDAAIELAHEHVRRHEFRLAAELVSRYEAALGNSPRYLNAAGAIRIKIGLPDRAWPLLSRADALQPGTASIRANLAACSVHVGELALAKRIYRELLAKHPRHQRNHYELSRLVTAEDDTHVTEMLGVIEATDLPDERNIYLLYALGKELEDLERWDEAFDFYARAGAAALSVSAYEVDADVRLIESICRTCDADWLDRPPAAVPASPAPLFVVGLPRSGTTLVERILSSHSSVDSVGETFMLQQALRAAGDDTGKTPMSVSGVERAAAAAPGDIARDYLDAVAYKLDGSPRFVEKLPENVLYAGFIARCFPDSPIVLVRRKPMDVCFAMFKQSFFRYAYSLDHLGRYYVAYERLCRHWKDLLGERLIEVHYEDLVARQEVETRTLLERTDLAFEPACLEFERNTTAVNSASAAQVRQKIHSRSVDRWRQFEYSLEPLADYLAGHGIVID